MKVMFRGETLIRKSTALGSEIRRESTFLLKTLVLAAALLFFWGIPGQASAAITSTNLPDQGTMQNTPVFPVNQVITVIFNQDIGTVTPTGITLTRNSDSAVGNFAYYKSGSTLTIVPVFDGSGGTGITTANHMLEYNTKYKLDIASSAVQDGLGSNLLSAPATYTFTTAHSFQILLQTPGTFGSLITTNAPRGLNIIIPKKYMTKFDISYITKAGTTALASPLTSVDITADADVGKIEVSFGGLPIVVAKNLDNVFNAGYQGVMTQTDASGKEVGLDIKFSAYDKDGRLLEERTEKLDPKGKKSVTTNPKKLDGTKTLQDLIVNNGKLFTDILSQYSTSDLSLSIR